MATTTRSSGDGAETAGKLPFLYLSSAEVEALLPMGECIALMEGALRELALGGAVQPLRSVMRLEGRPGLLGFMPGQIRVPGAGAAGEPPAAEPGSPTAGTARSIAGIKVVSIFPGNRERGDESHFGVVLLFETETGRPIASVDAAAITTIRTAAVSALATRLLARAEAGELALLGAGVQARSHLAAMREVRELRRVRVWSRRPESARRFAAEESARHGLAVEAAPSAAAAVAGADLVCTVTSSREPVLAGAWLSPGAHVNAVGSSIAAARELDSAAVSRSRLFVDRRESTVNESGDYLFPLREGAIAPDHIQGEIGDLLLGRVAGRRGADEITLFKSLGLAVEDLAAADHAYRRALAQSRGIRLDSGADPAPARTPADGSAK
jgi:alanine dehydrogenase